jgi:ribosomal protein S12 methylthiotransferase accessory factor YcaO
LTARSSGADFANQRQFFRELGVRVQLIRTEEDGKVEENAAIIAATIRTLGDTKIILVSTSKAGPGAAPDIEIKSVALASVVAEALQGRWPDESLIAKLLQSDY